MKKTFHMAIVAVVLLVGIPALAGAAPVLEETGFIYGTSGTRFTFTADQTPLDYELTLTDFAFPDAFSYLSVAITTSTDYIVELVGPGTVTFGVELGTTYFANVLGVGAGELGIGLFGIDIRPVAVPVPATLLLLGSGLVALTALKRRRQ